MNTENIIVNFNSICETFTRTNNINNNNVIKIISANREKPLELFINNIKLCIQNQLTYLIIKFPRFNNIYLTLYRKKSSDFYTITIDKIENIKLKNDICYNEFKINNLNEKNSKIIADEIIKIFTESLLIENTIKNLKRLNSITMKLQSYNEDDNDSEYYYYTITQNNPTRYNNIFIYLNILLEKIKNGC